ncbi:unnamed protein product [Moneuplotes crassus]|uniref:Uncharacterized protein n=1 Tax=Euplotes crassus TaxID=5936 RepID=A0AAD1UM07_EUPCR|nr:unnamed protein product [Moneuplotes crassus]
MAKVHEHKIIYPEEDRPRVVQKVRKVKDIPRYFRSQDSINLLEEDTPDDISEPTIQRIKIWTFDITLPRSSNTEIVKRESLFNSKWFRSNQETVSKEEGSILPSVSVNSQPFKREFTPIPEDSDTWEEQFPRDPIKVLYNLNKNDSERIIVFKTFNRKKIFFLREKYDASEQESAFFQLNRSTISRLRMKQLAYIRMEKSLALKYTLPRDNFCFLERKLVLFRRVQ